MTYKLRDVIHLFDNFFTKCRKKNTSILEVDCIPFVRFNLILEFCTAQDMYLCNTYFKRKEEQLLTYSSGGSQSQIDFIITNHRCRKFVQNTKVIPGEAAFCQHRLVVSDLNIPVDLRPVKKPL